MPSLDSLEDLMQDELKEIYDAERQPSAIVTKLRMERNPMTRPRSPW